MSIFGEWERLPVDGIFLPEGDYGATLVLTEESFHGSGGTYAGFWAGAMSAWIEFSIGSGPRVASFSASPIRGAGPSADRQVNVQLAASAEATGWWIGESAEVPASGWLDSEPSSYDIVGDPGPITLYARVRDDGGVVSDPLTASLIYEPPRELRIRLDGEEVVLGQWSGASAGFDPDFDSPAAGAAKIWLGDRLSKDYRDRDDGRWRLRVDAPGELSWNVDEAEPAKWLLLQALENAAPGAPPFALQPGATRSVDAGDFLVAYELPQALPLPDDGGWQLLGGSLLTPASLGELFPGARIWRWDAGYEPCLLGEGLVSGAGYWLHQSQPAPLLLGIPFAHPIQLRAGWNLIALAESASLNAPEIGAIWGWEGRFRRVSVLQPGRGYWVHADADVTVQPQGR